MKRQIKIKTLETQYNELKRKVNPFFAKRFQYGSSKGKSNKLLKEQIGYMKYLLKGIKKYGSNTNFHSKLYKKANLTALDEGIKRLGGDDGIEHIKARINHMSAETFDKFYKWVDKNNLKSIVFEFNIWYLEDQDQVDEAVEEINNIIDEFYEETRRKV